MKLIEPATGMKRAVYALLGKAAEKILTSTLIDRPVRRGGRPPVGPRSNRRSASVKGGVRRG